MGKEATQMKGLDALKEALSFSGLAAAFVPTELAKGGIGLLCTSNGSVCTSYAATCDVRAAVCNTCAAVCDIEAAVCNSLAAQCESQSVC